MADILFEYLQHEVIEFFAPGFSISQGSSQARDPLKDAQVVEILFKSGLISRNEGRLDIGKEPIGPGRNVFVDNTYIDNELNEREMNQGNGATAQDSEPRQGKA
ncbi:hypothetical protein [Pseudanabaena sp. FACHB-2040]|uniref:hypothetical protein n=1 Tax=Pseudanabaena sp. FACHB-2040 TaxID=2692859 RepID=UPI001683E45F|nr:hypothetical protein [Pseudanabaena sp. FACHB-2040]MBD2261084.1 hypothetical protein [Pseudanabaena sp. FACHB-2040]